MLLNLPDSRLHTDTEYDCGLVCVRSVLEYYGKSLSYADRLRPTPTAGTSPTEIVTCLSLAGLKVVQGTWSLDMMRYAGFPVICAVNATDGVDHWVVIRQAAKSRVYYFDPEAGNKSLPSDTFQDRWTSVGPKSRLLSNFGIGVGV